MENLLEQNQITFTPEKSKQIALARLDLIHKWLEFRRKSTNKLQADYDFVKLHNTSNSHLFEILGKISRGSLHRWHSILNETEDYTKLLPQYKYSSVDDYRTVLNDNEIKIFMGLLLHPNRLSIRCYSLTRKAADNFTTEFNQFLNNNEINKFNKTYIPLPIIEFFLIILFTVLFKFHKSGIIFVEDKEKYSLKEEIERILIYTIVLLPVIFITFIIASFL